MSALCEGRVCVVTGAGRGIGREHALLLASHGAKVVVNDVGGSMDGEGHNEGPAHDVVAEIVAAGGEAVANGDDISDFAGAGRLIDQAIETFGDPAHPFASLIECRLETGRTHQIRVHLTHLGHPLIGDASYGKARRPPRPKDPAEEMAFAAAMNFPRQALHAYLLGFQHPSLHKTLRFESKWPADLAALIAALRGLKKP